MTFEEFEDIAEDYGLVNNNDIRDIFKKQAWLSNTTILNVVMNINPWNGKIIDSYESIWIYDDNVIVNLYKTNDEKMIRVVTKYQSTLHGSNGIYRKEKVSISSLYKKTFKLSEITEEELRNIIKNSIKSYNDCMKQKKQIKISRISKDEWEDC